MLVLIRPEATMMMIVSRRASLVSGLIDAPGAAERGAAMPHFRKI
jgi:hypothetical protein